MSDPAELTLTGPRRRDPAPQGLLGRSHQGAARAHRANGSPTLNAFARVEAEDALKSAKAADRALARWQARRARCTACRSPTRTCTTRRASSPNAARRSARAGSRPRPPRRSSGSKPPARSGSARSTWWSSPTGRPATTSTPAMCCNPWDPSAHHRRLVVRLGLRRSARGSYRRRSAPTPAARSACRRISAASTGFKPTNGRVSRANAMPLSFTLDTVGPLAQTAEDCALIVAIIAGPDPLDPTTAGAPIWDAKAAKRPAEGHDHRHAEELLCGRSRSRCRRGAR